MHTCLEIELSTMIPAAPAHATPHAPIRVIVADDHAGYLRAITATLERAGIWVVAIAATGQGAIDAIRSERPAIALVDLRMPGLSGTEVAAAMRRQVPETRVVILSAYAEQDIVENAVQAGAFGYISKDSTPGAIVAAITSCADGVPSLPATLPVESRRLLSDLAIRRP